MFEKIDKNNVNKLTKLAIALSRYKREGYTIIGVGYPISYNETIGLIKMCDFFVDDSKVTVLDEWKKYYTVHDLVCLQKIEKAVIVVFSLNRYSVKKFIEEHYKDFIIYDAFDDYKEIIQTTDQIEQSQFLTYKSTDIDNINILNGIVMQGNSTIVNMASKELTIHSLELYNNSMLYNQSRFQNRIDGLVIEEGSLLSIHNDGKADIRDSCLGSGTRIEVFSGTLELSDALFGPNCRVHVHEHLSIGTGCIIAWNTNIMDGDGHSLYYDNCDNKAKGIEIGDNVWIGSNVTILKGVTIGTGSVIGTGSIVQKSIPPHSLVVGNPARVIKSDISWNYRYK